MPVYWSHPYTTSVIHTIVFLIILYSNFKCLRKIDPSITSCYSHSLLPFIPTQSKESIRALILTLTSPMSSHLSCLKKCVCDACLFAVLCVSAVCIRWCRGQKCQLLSLSTIKTWDRDSHWTGSSPLWLDLTTDRLQGSTCPRPWMVGYKPTLPCSAFYMGAENMNSGLHAYTLSPLLTELPPQSHSQLSCLANTAIVSLHLVTSPSPPSSRFFFCSN